MCHQESLPSIGCDGSAICSLLRSILGAIVALALVLTSNRAIAQTDFPRGVVRIVIGAGPGTPPDVVARTLADALSRLWGTPVITENVVGVSGNAAGARVAEADPDGHTLLLAANSGIVMNPSLYRNMPYAQSRICDRSP